MNRNEMFGVVARIFAALAVVGGLTDPRVYAGIISSNDIPFQQQITREIEKNMDLGLAHYGFKGVIREAIPIDPATDCMFMTSEARPLVVETVDSSDTVCGIYIFTEPDEIVEISFLRMDVPCGGKDLIGVVNGWELNGQYFPSPPDHHLPLDERLSEFCGQKISNKIFLSSQNVALVQYRIPTVGKGFTVSIKFIKNRQPCNVVAIGNTDPFTLRNYGRRINCTFMTIFPAVVRAIALDVGSKSVRGIALSETETGTIHQCDKYGAKDEVQIGGSVGLDTSRFESMDTICGVDSKPWGDSKKIGCEVTAVRLVSSGNYDNSVTITARPAEAEEMFNMDFTCGLDETKHSQ